MMILTKVRRVALVTLRRALYAIPVLFGVTAIVFAMAGASPLDPLAYRLGAMYTRMSAQAIAQLEDAWGLTLPWYVQYEQWIAHGLTGDWGYSMSLHLPITQVVANQLPWTVLLSTCGLVIALILAFSGGLACARYQGSWFDNTVVALAQLVASTPGFIAGSLTLGVFAGMLGLIPAGGLTDPGAPITLEQVARHLVGPAIILGITMTPAFILHTREAMISTMSDPYIFGARLRGIPEGVIRRNHALHVAILPVIGLLGARIPEVITGALVIETIFSWPGVAKGFVDAGLAMDFPLLAVLSMLATIMVLAGTWLSDVIIIWIDPRVSADV